MARSNFYFGSLSGVALGAGVMYLLDPRSGRRRRAETRQKAMHAARETAGMAEVVARDAANRSRGIAHRVANAFQPAEADDEIICERVRSALGRLSAHAGPISVTCQKSVITLSGPILARELPKVLAGVRLVRGVKGIENHLEPHVDAAHISALQGGRSSVSIMPNALRANWSPSNRFAFGALGLGLIGYGLANRRWWALGLGLFGATLLTRSFAPRRTSRIEGRRAIDVQKSIYINRPVEQVFGFFRQFENFPKFMTHVREIQQVADNRWRWRVYGPAHLPVEWEAEAVEFVPNELIAWQSISGSMVKTSGFVRFMRDERGGTRLNVHLHYAPIAGALGHTFARLFGADPKRQMDDDLLRLKSLLETGKSGHYRQAFEPRAGAEEWQH
jgi:uncharacterized membrane protein/gas vesicle protein